MSMFGNAMGGEGSWWITSKEDPKWNARGRGFVSGLHGSSEMDKKLEQMKVELGKPPDDLEIGWMKD